VAVGDYAGQAAQAIANLRTALAAAGADLTDVISTRVLVATTRQAVTRSGGWCGTRSANTTCPARWWASPCSATTTSWSRSKPWPRSSTPDRGRSRTGSEPAGFAALGDVDAPPAPRHNPEPDGANPAAISPEPNAASPAATSPACGGRAWSAGPPRDRGWPPGAGARAAAGAGCGPGSIRPRPGR